MHRQKCCTQYNVDDTSNRDRLRAARTCPNPESRDCLEQMIDETMLPVTEDPTGIAVHIGIADTFTPDEHVLVQQAIARLGTLLPATTLILRVDAEFGKDSAPHWFRIVRTVTPTDQVIKPCLEVEFRMLCAASAAGSLQSMVHEAVAPVTAAGYTLELLRGFATGRTHHEPAPADDAGGDARIVCIQLAALERFNRKLTGPSVQNDFFIARCDARVSASAQRPEPVQPVPESPGMARLHAIGAAADHFAILYQTRWQRLVLATTNQLASLSPRSAAGRLLGLCGLLLPVSLILCGIVSALGYAIFSELSLGCQKPDFFLGEMCMSSHWKHWVGPAAFFMLYLLSLVWAWCRYASAKADRVENQHQDYRLLAECLRVQYVLGVLGEPICVHAFLPAAEHAEAGWVRMAILSLEHERSVAVEAAATSPSSSTTPSTPSEARMLRVRQDFIDVQAAYHAEKLIVRREHALVVLNWLASLGMRSFLVILLVLAAQVAAEVLFEMHFLSEIAHHVLIILQIVSLAFWGSMHKVADLFGLEQEIQRGKLVLHALREVQGDVSASPARLLQALRFFTVDQAAWHALQRAKPIEAATGA
jgi:hypothetical protein